MPYLGDITTREEAALQRAASAPQRTPEEIAAMNAASAAYQASEAAYRAGILEEEKRRTDLVAEIIANETEIALLGAQIEMAEAPGANSPEAQAEALQNANELIELLHLLVPPGASLGSVRSTLRRARRQTSRVASSISSEAARAVDVQERWRGLEEEAARTVDLEARWRSVEEEASRVSRRDMKDNVRMVTRTAARVVATSLLISFSGIAPVVGAILQGYLPPGMLGEVLVHWGGTMFAILSPEDTNRILRDVAKVANQVDLGVYLPQMLYTLAFTELVAEAQESRDERDRFRLKVAALRAQIETRGGPWLAGARTAAQIAQAVVITVATAGLATPIILTVQAGMAALSAAVAALQLRQAIETMKAAMREMERQAAAYEFEEEEEEPEDFPLPSGGAPGGRNPLVAMLLKYGLIGAVGLVAVVALTSKKR